MILWRRAAVLIALVVALLASGCQPHATTTAPTVTTAKAPGPGGLVLEVRVPPGPVVVPASGAGVAAVDATVSVVNSSDTTFAAVAVPDVRVTDAAGDLVYDSRSARKSPLSSGQLKPLAPHARLIQSVTFGIVRAGRYIVQAYVQSAPSFDATAQVELTAVSQGG